MASDRALATNSTTTQFAIMGPTLLHSIRTLHVMAFDGSMHYTFYLSYCSPHIFFQELWRDVQVELPIQGVHLSLSRSTDKKVVMTVKLLCSSGRPDHGCNGRSLQNTMVREGILFALAAEFTVRCHGRERYLGLRQTVANDPCLLGGTVKELKFSQCRINSKSERRHLRTRRSCVMFRFCGCSRPMKNSVSSIAHIIPIDTKYGSMGHTGEYIAQPTDSSCVPPHGCQSIQKWQKH